MEDLTKRLDLVDFSFQAALEVHESAILSQHDQKRYRTSLPDGVLVERGHDAVHSESHRRAREALTSMIKIDVAKHLA